MKKPTEASRLKATVRAAPPNCMIYVCAEYAHDFKTVPKDGRTYIVEDPRRPHVLHWTSPDGSYKCYDTRNLSLTVGGIPFDINPKRVFCRDAKKGKQTRFAHEICAKATVVRQDDAPPAICLIDIHRVMRITGFKKSFIYKQLDFPHPVRLGTSRRSSVRWVQEEILLWVNALLASRNSNTATK